MARAVFFINAKIENYSRFANLPNSRKASVKEFNRNFRVSPKNPLVW